MHDIILLRARDLTYAKEPVKFKVSMLNAKELLEQSGETPHHDVDVLELITSLDTLREMGVLSQDEYTRKKNELLKKL